MEEGWSIKYLSRERWRMTMLLLSVAGARGIIFSAAELIAPEGWK
jgi:hypothetical protein